jgi:hypothetical protein
VLRGARQYRLRAFATIQEAGKRFDMGKCCLHFKVLDDLEPASAKVIGMSTSKEYIAYYKRVKRFA